MQTFRAHLFTIAKRWKQLKCLSTSEWKDKLSGVLHTWTISYSAVKQWSAALTHCDTNEPRKHAESEEARHKRTDMVRFQLQEMCRTGKALETDIGWRLSEVGSGKWGATANGGGVYSRGWKHCEIRWWWWLHNITNTLKGTEFYIWNGLNSEFMVC